MAVPVHGADWTLSPSVRAATTYTDNIALSAADEESEWVTELAPAVRLSGDGRRANLDLQYRVRSFFHDRESARDRTQHEGAADATVELVREHLFLDGNASRAEDLISADQTVPNSNIFAVGRQDVTTYGIGPRLEYAFGSFAGLQATYGRDWLDRSGRNDDRITDTATASLASGPRFNRWGWRLAYRRVDEEPEEDLAGTGQGPADRVFERGEVEVNVRAGARTQLFAVGGTEDNRFESADAGDAIDGDFWEAGLRWNPRRRTRIELAAGERFFGETARASITAEGRRLRVGINYRESLVTSSSLRIERTNQLLRDADGNIVLGPGGEPVSVVVPIATIEDDVILEERASVDLGWQRSHSAIAVRVLASEREFLEADAVERNAGIDVSYTWTRLSRTVVTLGTGYNERDFAGSDREDTLHSARLNMRRSFGGELDGSLELAYDDLDTEEGADDGYEAARITATLVKRF